MAREYDFHVYMTTNFAGTVLYTGVTNDLYRRLWEHQRGEGSGFTTKYHADRLLYYEHFDEVTDAIAREKQIKGWTRAKKEKLIATMNPARKDLSARFTLGQPTPEAERAKMAEMGRVLAEARAEQAARRLAGGAVEGPSARKLAQDDRPVGEGS